MKVAVVGIRRVGLPFAAVSSKDYETNGIDLNEAVVCRVNDLMSGKKMTGHYEPQLDDYLLRYGLTLRGYDSCTSDDDRALRKTNEVA